MIFITGDTHGDWISRFRSNAFPEAKEMTKDDYVIVCGDFGIWHDTVEESHSLDWLDSKQFTTLFVDGNHSNFDRLNALPIEEWSGGKIHFIRPSIIHLMRGQVFELQDRTFFTFGGASSHDIKDGILDMDDPNYKAKKKRLDRDFYSLYRVNHLSWWKEELPTEAEMAEGWSNLKRYDNSVDYIISHSPSSSVVARIGAGLYNTDIVSDYLSQIHDAVEYKQHFCGHMHINENFNEEKTCCLYEQIIRLL